MFEGPVVPKYYYVPRDHLQAERADPGSQRKVASGEGSGGNLFLWGQSVYIISQLLGGWEGRGGREGGEGSRGNRFLSGQSIYIVSQLLGGWEGGWEGGRGGVEWREGRGGEGGEGERERGREGG